MYRKSSLFAHQCRRVICYRKNATISEYVDTPIYPPITDLSEDAKKKREKQKWHDKITSLGTYEQKLMEFNMPKGYGYWSCLLDDNGFQINALPFLKFVTRTAVTHGLPTHYYKEVETSSRVAAERLAPYVEALITLHYSHVATRSAEQEETSRRAFLQSLDTLLCTALPNPTHARTVIDPRVEAWWLAGGLHNVGADRPEWRHLKEESRTKKLWVRNLFLDREEPYMGDVAISSKCSPSLVVREKRGLPQVEDRIACAIAPHDGEASAAAAEECKDDRLHPLAYGYECDRRAVCLLPGYWPGERRRYSRLFYHSRGTLDDTAGLFEDISDNAMLQKLIIATHSQGLSQAAIFGFGPVTELTYPVVQQSVVTDGRRWTIALHQLNTVALHSENTVDNPASNRLWVGPEQCLWESVHPTTGAVSGLSITVLEQIARLYKKETATTADETPYLAPYKYLWNHPAIPWYREMFHDKTHTLTSGGKFYPYKPELYAWEKIYKLDFNTMHLQNANKKFYEGHRFRLLPQDRTLKDHLPRSIRLADRPLGRRDPLKRLPLIDSEKLYVHRYKRFFNYRYHPK